MANTFFKINTVTVGAGGAATIAFNVIPQIYSDLKIIYSGRNVNNAYTFSIALNGTTVTQSRRFYATGSSGASDTYNGMYTDYSGAVANSFGNAEINIFNYSASTAKSLAVDAVSEDNYSSAYMNLGALLSTTTIPISSVSLIPESGNFAQYSSATLYGVKRL